MSSPTDKFKGWARQQFDDGAQDLLNFGGQKRNAVAFLDIAGNDSTAVIGDCARPFRTAQYAYSSGASVIYVGVGSFNGYTGISGVDRDITLLGVGADVSIIGPITGTRGNIYGNGCENITIGEVTWQVPAGANGADQTMDTNSPGGTGTAGTDAPNCIVAGVNCTGDVILQAGAGGAGGQGSNVTNAIDESILPSDGGPGGNGGAAGTLTVRNCIVAGYVVSQAGAGGNGGNGGSDWGRIVLGANGGTGGNEGIVATPAQVVVINSTVLSAYAASPGPGPGQGGAAGTGVADGSEGISGAAYSAGAIASTFATVTIAAANGEDVTGMHASMIAGTFTP